MPGISDLVVYDGCAVVAQGVIAKLEAGGRWLIVGSMSWDEDDVPLIVAKPPPPNRAVRLVGRMAWEWVGKRVEVSGELIDDTIYLEDEGISEPTDAWVPPVEFGEVTPCPDPPDGWSVVPPPGYDPASERLHSRIRGYTRERSDIFGMFCSTYPRNGPIYRNAEGGISPVPVITIGTTVDPESVRSDLEAILPEQFCLTRVNYSFDELDVAQAAAVRVFAGRFFNVGQGNQTVWVDLRSVRAKDAEELLEYDDLLTIDASIRPAELSG